MSDAEILRQRADARERQGERDGEIYRLHERAVAALSDPDIAEDVRLAALLTTRAWEDGGMCGDDHIAAWRTILAMEDKDAKARILADSDEAAELRRNTPFTELALKYGAPG